MYARALRVCGWILVTSCISFLLALAVEGEWHAAKGHYLFNQKRFEEAVYNLSKVADRPTAYQRLRGLPPLRRYLAQSLLASGRTEDAAAHYAALAKDNLNDVTSQLVSALRDWKSSRHQEAVDRVRAVVGRKDSCGVCTKTYEALNASLLAADALQTIRIQKAAAIGAVTAPAQCLTYRAGAMSARFLVGQIIDRLITPDLIGKVLWIKVGEEVVDGIRSLVGRELRAIVARAAESIGTFAETCTSSVELPTLPTVGGFDLSEVIELLNRVPYVKDGKHAAADLHAVGQASLSYGKACVDEWNSAQAIAAGENYVGQFWAKLRREAANPEFIVAGVEGIVEPPRDGTWRGLRDWLPW